jgi:putative transposase
MLAEALLMARQKHSLHLLAYIFMPSHVHLLVYPNESPYDIAKILQTIKQSASKRIMFETRKSSPELLNQFLSGNKTRPYQFWQSGGGYDRNIVSHKALRNTIDYIHNNPIRAGLVDLPEQWRWSSFRDWSGVGEGPIPIDKERFPL